ncbi:CpaF family protein [Gluconacetobacter sacchari]|uniref:CpaF family protein n=2 Tax=Gluconacetobacter sacchari TaxID=92759 RepID=A0A7W4IDF8_9PROT|nr:CpaF family protein [Gluconacetobacter sacchari]MBB2160840.1 CpaF family protein [Gluconacetobacter sacchari]
MTGFRPPAFGRRAVGGAPPPAPGPVARADRARTFPRQDASPEPGVPPPILADLRAICLDRLDPAAVAVMAPERLLTDMERLVAEIATERRIQLNSREQRALAEGLVFDMLGLGPLEPLLDNEAISEIMVNGPDQVFVETGGRLVASGVRFRDAAHLAAVCQRIASAVGRRVDESSPMVDARLRDGSRVNIVFPPLALNGPYLTIRKFGGAIIDFDRLIALGSLSAPVARVLRLAARARLNILVSGGTGAGKTTLLNALSRMIDAGERVVTIEDAAELRLQQPHVVRLETRPANLEGGGEVTQRDLMRNALRMRPDRIIIGECRGQEAFDMLQAMNTGHDGSMSTVHANTARDALTRIENMVQMGNMGLPPRAIRAQIVGAVDLVIQMERHRDGGRRIVQVTEICGLDGDIVTLNDIFRFEIQGGEEDGRLAGRYRVNRGPPAFLRRLLYSGLEHDWQAALEQAGEAC